MRTIGKWSVAAVGLTAMIFLTTSATGAAALRVDTPARKCTSHELEGKGCQNPGPGVCWNACAFYCGDDITACYQCCMAFSGGAKDNCQAACDEIPS